MTNNLYQNIQALGNRMASNLERMGVSASFNDGGLTLADKILQIQRFNDGIILYGDKIIAQSADTVNLYALLLDDNIPQSGKTVTFTSDVPISSRTMPTDYTNLGDDYYISSSKTGSSYDQIGSGATGIIKFNSTKIDVFYNSSSSWRGEVTYNGKPFHIKNGVLTYKDTSNVEQTIDVSSINTGRAYSDQDTFTVSYCTANVTTDSNGVATATYTCSGAGKRIVQAFSGSVVSQPSQVIDGTFLDVANGSDYNDTGWTNTNLVTTLDRTDGTKIEQSNTSSVGSRYRTPSPNTDICIEFDFKIVNASDRVVTFRNGTSQVKVIYGSNVDAQANTWTHIKITLKDDKYYLNDSSSGTALSTWNRFYLESYSGNSMKYKNFVIYPI